MPALDINALRADRLVSLFASRWPTSAAEEGERIPILMYHSVSDELDTQRRPYYRIVTSPEAFERQMRFLAREGYAAISLAEAGQRLQAPQAATRRRVVITFDDGLRDFLTGAYPVLSDLGFSATVFLATGYLGCDFVTGQPCLGTREVARLAAAGIEFGSHTVTHPHLREVPDAQLERELSESRRAIEDVIGRPVNLFSMPYAFPDEDTAFVDRLGAALRRSGYTLGVTTRIGRATPQADPLFLPRLPVNELDDEKLLAAKLRGGYDWLRPAQRTFRRLKKQLREALR